MPATSKPKSDVVPVRITRAMRLQIDEMIEAGYGTQNEVIRTAVDRMHQQIKQEATQRAELTATIIPPVAPRDSTPMNRAKMDAVLAVIDTIATVATERPSVERPKIEATIIPPSTRSR